MISFRSLALSVFCGSVLLTLLLTLQPWQSQTTTQPSKPQAADKVTKQISVKQTKVEINTPQSVLEMSDSKQQTANNDWPAASILSFKEQYKDYDRATEHIIRSVTFNDFAALSTAMTDRLVRYTQVVISAPTKDIVHLCWGHSTQAEIVSAFEAVRSLALTEGDENDGPLPVFQGSDRWTFTATDGSTGSEGTPITLTWSFVPDGTMIDNDEGSTLPNNLIATLNSTYGTSPSPGDYTQAPWFELFTDAFDSWAATTGNIYVYEPMDDGGTFPATGTNGLSGSLGVRGDVRIAGVYIDGNSSTLAFNYFPNGGDMVIDTGDSSNFTNNEPTKFQFVNMLAHEHGHGLGLDHVCPDDETKLMEPFISTAYFGPQLDDVLTIHGIYGDLLERQGAIKNNDTTATAVDLGSQNSGYTSDKPSISNSNDIDLYKFEISSARQLNITVTPTNETAYLEGVQTGSCSGGTLFNPETRQDLIIRVLDTDGTTVLGSSNSTGIGQAEVLTNVQLLQTGQDYYVEITGGGENSGDANNAQLYELDIELVDPSAVQVSKFTITNESCSPGNGTPDPDEFITGFVTIENIGSQNATGISVTLTGSSNLTIQGNATQNVGTLTPGQTVDATYTFSLSGACTDQESITFRADSSTGFVERFEDFTLGTAPTIEVEDFDSTTVGQIPTGYSQSSVNPTANWSTTAANSDSTPNSVFSAGVDSVNSAFFTSPNLNDIAADSELRFDHSYNMEYFYDGGRLEISINGGSWTEWIATGGTFTQNGYDITIDSNFSSPIAGQDAWSGNSFGFIRTIATFPPSSYGQPVSVRWHQANDNSTVNVGWWIDNIEIYRGPMCCESTLPTVSVTAPSPTIEEFTPSTTADFIITSDIAVSGDLDVTYTLSGDATSGSDFVALAGTATIPSSLSMVAIPVTAITDSEIEGDEILTLTLSPSIQYGIATPAASITIKDLPFDEFRDTNFGAATVNIADDEDFDFDSILNLIEYAFRLDPTAPAPLPFSLMVENSGGPTLELTYYEDTDLVDVNYIVETSSTLLPNSWTTSGVTITDGSTTNGLKTRTASIAIGSQPGFIRIRIERIIP
ncbi:MAG: matrixin family metalloprotease [Opitutaceae bacterium]